MSYNSKILVGNLTENEKVMVWNMYTIRCEVSDIEYIENHNQGTNMRRIITKKQRLYIRTFFNEN